MVITDYRNSPAVTRRRPTIFLYTLDILILPLEHLSDSMPTKIRSKNHQVAHSSVKPALVSDFESTGIYPTITFNRDRSQACSTSHPCALCYLTRSLLSKPGEKGLDQWLGDTGLGPLNYFEIEKIRPTVAI